MKNIIDAWTGRLGNNIFQLLRCIHFSLNVVPGSKISSIEFPTHRLLIGNVVRLSYIEKDDDRCFKKGSFFSSEHDPSLYEFKLMYQKYLSPLVKIKLDDASALEDDDVLYIHIRGGDIFSSHPHAMYLQPPVSYYANVISKYERVVLISEDRLNPCVDKLIEEIEPEKLIQSNGNTLEADLKILCRSRNLMIGAGTFGLLIYFMNTDLRRLYVPEYSLDHLPKGRWTGGPEENEDRFLHSLKMPYGYIKNGEWKNTPYQREIMVNF